MNLWKVKVEKIAHCMNKKGKIYSFESELLARIFIKYCTESRLEAKLLCHKTNKLNDKEKATNV